MVLVTGGTGFLGSYIIRQLVEKGYSVRAIKRSSSRMPFYIPAAILSQVEWVEGDILDLPSLYDAMQNIDTVIHSAAKVSFRSEDRDEVYQVNVEGTCNVINQCLESNIKKLVYISSVAALGRTADGETINEEKQWQETAINTNYAISKYKAELEVWRGIAEGLATVILNPSTILGYGDWNNSSCAIFKTVYNELPWYTIGVNGFVYVEDVAKATIALMEKEIVNERFIVNGENWPFKKLLETIADGFQKKPPHRRAGPMLARFAWRAEQLKAVFTGKPSLLSKESARIAQTKTYFDHSKILSRLPEFQFTPLEAAIGLSCMKYKELVNEPVSF
jgi:dihydroflavonol-4-reductase